MAEPERRLVLSSCRLALLSHSTINKDNKPNDEDLSNHHERCSLNFQSGSASAAYATGLEHHTSCYARPEVTWILKMIPSFARTLLWDSGQLGPQSSVIDPLYIIQLVPETYQQDTSAKKGGCHMAGGVLNNATPVLFQAQ